MTPDSLQFKSRRFLFADGSLDPESGIGFGAYLSIEEESVNLNCLRQSVKTKRFENTSPSKLELQSLLWALSEVDEPEIEVYTDSQTIIDLPSRKERLIASRFLSKRGNPIRNRMLYKALFEIFDRRNIRLHWVKGHKPTKEKTQIDQCFSIVDRASRTALRSFMKTTETG